MSKGSRQRPFNSTQFNANWDRIFQSRSEDAQDIMTHCTFATNLDAKPKQLSEGDATQPLTNNPNGIKVSDD